MFLYFDSVLATTRLSDFLFKSPFWSQTQLYSLLIFSVCLKYWPCIAFSSQSYSLFFFFAFFKTLAVSKPFTLSPLVACRSLSSLPLIYTSKPLPTKSTQSSIAMKPPLSSPLGTYYLSTADFGCSPPYIVTNFLVFPSIVWNSLFLQLTNTTKYLKGDADQVLTTWTKLQPFNFQFKSFFDPLKYSLETFSFISSSKNLSISKILRCL